MNAPPGAVPAATAAPAAPSAARRSAGPGPMRQPTEPYPGLRPFLPHESALLFGRERQVREVIERLAATQFVAVLGGSGSGKSSLIHAGVTPQLRSFGIPGAGDFWLVMSCTPGTNQSGGPVEHTPVTRLARNFSELLQPAGSPEEEVARRGEIAAVFRQEAGFARLLDVYAEQLAVQPGMDPKEARLLFVLDQFEELFHPTNKGVEDARLFVERVIDHFFAPHPNAFVVLTMRSEHLNDCAAFLELPDAINKASYLIRRLDDDELRQAITGPAQRFLRLLQRQPREGEALPAQVAFDEGVVERLLRDVKALTHDPDHLPLLQHILARLWSAAVSREQGAAAAPPRVPARITAADLQVAALAAPGGAALDDGLNTLRASLENWAEAIFQRHTPEQRRQLEHLLPLLAFKDPNTGMYTQQRVDTDDCAHFLGAGATRDTLHGLVADGLVGSVNYLFWDDRDPEQVTLKVSHESFIRGWPRFRRAVDAQAERFDELVAVLRKCGVWAAAGRPDDLLLEAGELRRLREARLDAVVAEPRARRDWIRFLGLEREGARLSRLAEGELDGYIGRSTTRVDAMRRSQAWARRRWLIFLGLAVALLPSVLFSRLIQEPVMQRALQVFKAGNLANRAPLEPAYPAIDAAGVPLAQLRDAAALIDLARSGSGRPVTRLSAWLIDVFDWLPPVHRQAENLAGVAGGIEPQVNGKLRQLLTGALWLGAARPAGAEGTAAPVVQSAVCELRTGRSELPVVALSGQTVLASVQPRPGLSRRAIFVAEPTRGDETVTVRSADIGPAGCAAGGVILAIPLALGPNLVFDGALRHLLVATAGQQVPTPSVTLHEIDWERTDDGASRVLQSQPRAVVFSPDAVERVARAAVPRGVGAMASWREPGSRVFELPGQNWRVFSGDAQRLPAGAEPGGLVPLQPADAGSGCAALAQAWPAAPGWKGEMFQTATHCFLVVRGLPPNTESRREEVMVSVYDRPTETDVGTLAANLPAPIASLPQIARLPAGDGRWLVGTSGPLDGWLAVSGKGLDGRERVLAAPWSTCALWHLSDTLQAQNPGPPAPGGAVRPRCRDPRPVAAR